MIQISFRHSLKLLSLSLALPLAVTATPPPEPVAARAPSAAPVYTVRQLTGLDGFPDTVSTNSVVKGAVDCAQKAQNIVLKRRLRTKTLEKFREMATQLCRDTGIVLSLASDHRSAEEQRGIWLGKRAQGAGLARERGCTLAPSGAARERSLALCILKYNSMPGSSRHHWGSDIDISSTENSYWTAAKGKKIKAWLDANAARYGFCQPYADKAAGIRKAGYNDEAWHWSYMPLAAPMLEEYKAKVTDKDIRAALGGSVSGLTEADIAALRIREDYVGTIADKCRNWKAE